MNVTVISTSETNAVVNISVDLADLKSVKDQVLKRLSVNVSAPGFRKGKAPIKFVEKQVGEKVVESEVLEEAINLFYSEMITQHKFKPISQPKIEIKKFIPDSELEFTAEIDIIPPIKLGNYKIIKKKRSHIKVAEDEIDKVVTNLKLRLAQKDEVKRAAKLGDEVWIDFVGKNKDGQDVPGASGKNYPLSLGSKTFIPGFEENIISLKAGDDKSFEVKFPPDYAHKPLANQIVNFDVKVNKVNSVKLPESNDEFAKKVGPFEDLASLKSDIKAQLMSQKMSEEDDKLKEDILETIISKSQIIIPRILVEDQSKLLKDDFIQNLTYKGLTLEQYLADQQLTEEKWVKQELEPKAERRVQVGMILSEVAQQEKLEVTSSMLDVKINAIKQQYSDPKTQAEFDKPEQRRDVANRLLAEMTLNKLVEYATKS